MQVDNIPGGIPVWVWIVTTIIAVIGTQVLSPYIGLLKAKMGANVVKQEERNSQLQERILDLEKQIEDLKREIENKNRELGEMVEKRMDNAQQLGEALGSIKIMEQYFKSRSSNES